MELGEERKQGKESGPFVDAPLGCADLENSSMFSPTGNPQTSSSAGGPTLNHIAMDGLPADPNVRQMLLMQYQGQSDPHSQTMLHHDSVGTPSCYTGSMLASSQMPGQMHWPHGDGIARDLCSHMDSLACPARSHLSAAFPPDFLCDSTNIAYDPFAMAPPMDLAFYQHGLQPSPAKRSDADMGYIMPPTTPGCEAPPVRTLQFYSFTWTRPESYHSTRGILPPAERAFMLSFATASSNACMSTVFCFFVT
jgi:hypothetical protein